MRTKVCFCCICGGGTLGVPVGGAVMLKIMMLCALFACGLIWGASEVEEKPLTAMSGTVVTGDDGAILLHTREQDYQLRFAGPNLRPASREHLGQQATVRGEFAANVTGAAVFDVENITFFTPTGAVTYMASVPREEPIPAAYEKRAPITCTPCSRCQNPESEELEAAARRRQEERARSSYNDYYNWPE